MNTTIFIDDMRAYEGLAMQPSGCMRRCKQSMSRLLAAVLLTVSFTTAHAQQRFDSEAYALELTQVADGLENPWSLAFLPDGRMLVTERPGRLRIIDAQGAVSEPIAGVPAVAAVGQGGLLDVVLAPDFATSQLLFLSYAEARDGGNATAVARARLNGMQLQDVKVIFRQQPAVDSPGHFGSRLVFDRDGALFVTLGERQAKHFTIRAQDLETHFGKVVRIKPEGGARDDNPFLLVPGAQPEIYSYGHRNVQGAALHPQTGELWVTEHGPRGGDELNLVKPGANYGWPLVTYGVAYNGDVIGVGQERVGIEPPKHYWVPSIATSGLAFYSGEPFAKWQGNVFSGGLYGVLMRLELNGNAVVKEERLLDGIKKRIRDVRVGPDGLIYLLTDNRRGEVLRLSPVTR